MFGHDVISWTPINNLLMAEMKTFNASAEVTKDDSSNYYVIKPTNAGYVTYYSKSGEQVGSNYGNAEMSMMETVNSVISSLPDGSTYIIDGFFPGEGVENSPATGGSSDTDSNDCASENRVKGTDDVCGDCLSGFAEDSTGVCVAEVSADETDETETNWLLYGGIGVVALGAAVFFMKGKD